MGHRVFGEGLSALGTNCVWRARLPSALAIDKIVNKSQTGP
jgi:hypothetical protein